MCASPLPTDAFDGARLYAWARRAAAELDRRRVEINQLNVFPVPDADTGSNMAHTMLAAVAQADELGAGAGAREVAEALAVGAVRGARGNSGVVLSQVMRGLAESIGDSAADAHVVADALQNAVRFVDKAIAEPVEGTVITVLRAAAAAARQAVENAPDPDGLKLLDVAEPATVAARTALANTPSQLDALREAGVVDAGGTGLVIMLETLLDEARGAEGSADGGPGGVDKHVPLQHGDAAAAIEVLCVFRGDVDALEQAIAGMGDSLVIARISDTEAKVHIHSHDAGELVQTAYAMGEVSDLRLEALPPITAPAAAAEPSRLILAVTPPGSLTDLYSQAGAKTVAPGPDVISDMLAVIRSSASDEVIVLPNGLLSNQNLAAVEKTTRAMEQSITLLPTVRLVSGIAALAVHDPDQPLATAAFTMSEAAGEMRTAVAHRAEKGALVPGGAVAKGDVVVTSRGETLLIADSPLEAVEGACRHLLERGGEQVTILFDPEGESALTADELQELEPKIGVDVMVYPADGLGACAEIGVE